MFPLLIIPEQYMWWLNPQAMAEGCEKRLDQSNSIRLETPFTNYWMKAITGENVCRELLVMDTHYFRCWYPRYPVSERFGRIKPTQGHR